MIRFDFSLRYSKRTPLNTIQLGLNMLEIEQRNDGATEFLDEDALERREITRYRTFVVLCCAVCLSVCAVLCKRTVL